MSTKRNTRSANAADPVKPDQMRSVADWMKLPAETLKLVCNNNGVQIKGGKKQMAQKLFNKFHPDTDYHEYNSVTYTLKKMFKINVCDCSRMAVSDLFLSCTLTG